MKPQVSIILTDNFPVIESFGLGNLTFCNGPNFGQGHGSFNLESCTCCLSARKLWLAVSHSSESQTKLSYMEISHTQAVYTRHCLE